MCDYSLEHTASRPAKVGDRLVTRQFSNTTTRGFCPEEGAAMAVCLLPGTEISFQNEVQRELTGFQLFFLAAQRSGPSYRRALSTNQSG
jgi:hypothetical protein